MNLQWGCMKRFDLLQLLRQRLLFQRDQMMQCLLLRRRRRYRLRLRLHQLLSDRCTDLHRHRRLQ